MHVGDTIFIFCLALIIFGPKKLPEIGRQIGKLMAEFRRASNEFKQQIDEELRAAEAADRQKQISAASQVPAALATSEPVSASSDSYHPSPEASAPVIQPPSTGEPISHSKPQATYEQAYPEAAQAFENSTNGSMAPEESLSPVPYAGLDAPRAAAPPAEGEIEEQIEQAQAHHG